MNTIQIIDFDQGLSRSDNLYYKTSLLMANSAVALTITRLRTTDWLIQATVVWRRHSAYILSGRCIFQSFGLSLEKRAKLGKVCIDETSSRKRRRDGSFS